MTLVLCPYELTRADPVATLAALLARDPQQETNIPGIVTLAPRPGIDPLHDDAPLEVLKAWSWSEPLWRSGLITGEIAGNGPESMLQQTQQLLLSREKPDSPLQSLGDKRRDQIERDIAQGGTSPGVRLLVDAATERFAAAHRAPLFRSNAAPRRVGGSHARDLLRVSMPLPIGADGELLLVVRERLADSLEAVRASLDDVLESLRRSSEARESRRLTKDLLLPALQDYARAFADALSEFTELAALSGAPLNPAEVIVTARRLSPGIGVEAASRALREAYHPPAELALHPIIVISAKRSPWDVKTGSG